MNSFVVLPSASNTTVPIFGYFSASKEIGSVIFNPNSCCDLIILMIFLAICSSVEPVFAPPTLGAFLDSSSFALNPANAASFNASIYAPASSRLAFGIKANFKVNPAYSPILSKF